MRVWKREYKWVLVRPGPDPGLSQRDIPDLRPAPAEPGHWSWRDTGELELRQPGMCPPLTPS